MNRSNLAPTQPMDTIQSMHLQTALKSRKLSSHHEIEHSFSLRYQVYCKERHFLDEDHCPNSKESDEFDTNSLHFGVYAQGETMLGSVRLVMSNALGFPLGNHCSLDIDTSALHRQGNIAEISRLVLSKSQIKWSINALRGNLSISSIRDTGEQAVLALYKSIYQESKRQNITHWLAAMEPSLARLLKRYNFLFQPVGPKIDYYGHVRPYLADIREIERMVAQAYPSLFQSFMDGLEQKYRPLFARH